MRNAFFYLLVIIFSFLYKRRIFKYFSYFLISWGHFGDTYNNSDDPCHFSNNKTHQLQINIDIWIKTIKIHEISWKVRSGYLQITTERYRIYYVTRYYLLLMITPLGKETTFFVNFFGRTNKDTDELLMINAYAKPIAIKKIAN